MPGPLLLQSLQSVVSRKLILSLPRRVRWRRERGPVYMCALAERGVGDRHLRSRAGLARSRGAGAQARRRADGRRVITLAGWRAEGACTVCCFQALFAGEERVGKVREARSVSNSGGRDEPEHVLGRAGECRDASTEAARMASRDGGLCLRATRSARRVESDAVQRSRSSPSADPAATCRVGVQVARAGSVFNPLRACMRPTPQPSPLGSPPRTSHLTPHMLRKPAYLHIIRH